MYIYEHKLYDEFLHNIDTDLEWITETEKQDLFEYYCRIVMQYFNRSIDDYTEEDVSVLCKTEESIEQK